MVAIELIALPPGYVSIDESRFPDGDDSFVFEHLLYYCSLLSTLPAIGIEVGDNVPVVTYGHKYLRIALELGRPHIRAIVESTSTSRYVQSLVKRPGVLKLDWDEIDRMEQATTEIDQWHVFYFGRQLAGTEKTQFDTDVAGFFESVGGRTSDGRRVQVNHDDSDHRAEFRTTTPILDESWFGDYLTVVKGFNHHVAPIVSYQGRRFVG